MKRMLRLFIAGLYVFQLSSDATLLAQDGGSSSAPTLNNVRIEDNAVVLDMSQLMPYDVFTLSSPWRLVVEIPGTVYKTNFSRKKGSGSLVRRIRGYQFKENPLIARVVLDLNAPVNYSANAADSQIVIGLKKNEVVSQQEEAPKKKAVRSTSNESKRDLLATLPREVVSLDFEGADIRDVIRLMAETSNINMIFGPEVGGTISVHLKRVPFNEAFRTILNLKGLVASQLGRNILRITTPENLQEDKTKAIPYTKIIPINYLKADDMKQHLLAVMAASQRKGNITVVKESNSLVLTDSLEGISQAERLIEQLDERPKQVMIESRIVEINLNNGFDIGVQWEFASENIRSEKHTVFGLKNTSPRIAVDSPLLATGEGAAPPGGLGTGVNLPGPTSAGITFGLIKNNDILTATLAALVSDSKARVLASPKVVTVNGEAAKIEAVQDIPFRTSTVSGTGVVSNSFETVSAGIILDVKPTINAEERITLEIKPESSFPTQDSTEAGPIIRTRNAQTTVIVENGETLVIGGLIDDQDTVGVTKVPVLGDIPILGAFFRSQTKRKIRNELIVLVTPRIIEDL